MNVVITGASGFVGERLARRLLDRGHWVVALTRDDPPPLGCEIVRGSVTDLDAVRRALCRRDPDAVFHLAAHAKVEECRRDPLGCFESNVRGTYTLLSALSARPEVPCVVATTDHVYGIGHDVPCDELAPLRGGGSAYDISKAAADVIAMGFGQTQDVRVVRCGNIYGPGDRDLSRIIPSMIDDVLNGRCIQIRSDGTPIREYLHVDDAVDGYLAVLERGSEGRAYNIAAGESHSVITVAGLVYDAAERCGVKTKRPAQVLGTRRGDIQAIRLDARRARGELGWKSKISLEQGLRDTLHWWKDPYYGA